MVIFNFLFIILKIFYSFHKDIKRQTFFFFFKFNFAITGTNYIVKYINIEKLL